jgi:hypothetical protein
LAFTVHYSLFLAYRASEDGMKRIRLVAAWIALWLTGLGLVAAVPGLWAGQPPAVGGMMPEVILPIPRQAEERDYLGLKAGDTFKIPQITADVVIVEVFSMYCPLLSEGSITCQ